MPPLPSNRVTRTGAFSSIGIDYAGPVFIKNIYHNDCDSLHKAWISLKICTCSRAIYLDLATDLTGL